ncbi:hypothetical protein ACUNE0_11620 [Serratia sp. IR-2025]
MSEILLRKELRELRRQLELVKAERDAQQKRADALAVENQALKDGFEWLYAIVSSDEVSIPDGKYSAVTNAAAVLSETPATDAALAAIQAQGVEMAAAALDALSKQFSSIATQANFRATAVYLRTEVLPAIGEAK